ncbi:hypothetical protein PVAP13_3KG125052 [Panicum virgatum]|uniref:Uncharacterized protein n=1 Tax=Panicum virgatum TaxID=38727 RepID=A0A8T0UT29_PANVG|nr:hypothetical protein PVAP13_3KG125052 [Panicum virgatum]
MPRLSPRLSTVRCSASLNPPRLSPRRSAVRCSAVASTIEARAQAAEELGGTIGGRTEAAAIAEGYHRFAQNLYVSKYGFRQEEWSANQGNPFGNLNTPRPDSRELKRERDRAQSASLTHQEQKNERKRRHHGAYRMKNGITMRAESEISQQHTIDLTVMHWW